MRSVVTGRLGRVIYAQLEPEEDLLGAIQELAEKEGIKTGLVLDVTGGLSRVRITGKNWVDDGAGGGEVIPGVIEFEGLSDVSGHGIIGTAVDSWQAKYSHISEEAGRPYVHVHVSVESAGRVHTGHLIHGSTVRSVHPISHFTIVVAEVEGVNLEFRCSEETVEHYPTGVPIHRLTPAE